LENALYPAGEMRGRSLPSTLTSGAMLTGGAMPLTERTAVLDAEAPFVFADNGCGSVFAFTFGLEVLTADGLNRESSLRAEMPALDAGADGVLPGFIPRSLVFAVDAAEEAEGTRLEGGAAATGNLRLRCVICATAFTFASRGAATLGASEAAATPGALDGVAMYGACDGAGDSAAFATRAREDFAATFAGPPGVAG
jgi:hypothetical protein